MMVVELATYHVPKGPTSHALAKGYMVAFTMFYE
jgi:hypothetical protein